VVLGHRAAELRAHLAPWPVKFALNAETAGEMGVSIARGVEQLTPDTQAVFIALVDQPAVPPSVLQAVGAASGRLRVPEYGGRGGHPVFISLAFRAEMLNLDPQRGLRGLFDAQCAACR
jgi:molybdenum cofactor cytidylyltransferase